MLDQNGQFHSFSNDELKANTRKTTLGYGCFALAYIGSSLLISFLVELFCPSLWEEKWFEWCMSVLPRLSRHWLLPAVLVTIFLLIAGFLFSFLKIYLFSCVGP